MRFLVLGAFLLCSLVPGAARAQTPFGGDDTGFIPPDAATFTLEAKVGRNLSKLQKCVLKCHALFAKGKFPTDAIEDGCEGNCVMKFNVANAKLGTLPGCLNTTSLENLWVSILDSFNSQIYCGGSTAFGGDDTGNVPPDAATYKCESKVGSHVGKLLACEGKCHEKRAKGSLADDTAEDGCEAACKTKYDAANAKLTGCPPCLNASNLGDTMLSQGDNNNGQVYCAQ